MMMMIKTFTTIFQPATPVAAAAMHCLHFASSSQRRTTMSVKYCMHRHIPTVGTADDARDRVCKKVKSFQTHVSPLGSVLLRYFSRGINYLKDF